MGKRTLTGENTRKRAITANSFNKAGSRKSKNDGAVKNTNWLTAAEKTDNQTKAQSKNNNNTGRHDQVLFSKGEHAPNNDDIESNGSNDVDELIGLLQSKTKRSSSRFNKFEHDQGARLEKAREMIDGENGIITIWSTEMEKITSNVKRKIDDRLEREDEYIKKLKFGFEKYQSVTTTTLDNLTKLHTQSQKLGRDLDNDLKQLYAADEAELNEALERFIKQQKHIHKILLDTNKKDHNISALQKRLFGC